MGRSKRRLLVALVIVGSGLIPTGAAEAHQVSNTNRLPGYYQYNGDCWSHTASLSEDTISSRVISMAGAPYANGGCGTLQLTIQANVPPYSMWNQIQWQTYYGATICAWTDWYTNTGTSSSFELTANARAVLPHCGVSTYLANNWGYFYPRDEMLHTLSPNHFIS